MDNNIYVDGVKLPPPAKEGISCGKQIIWSENAGRTASCEFVGDVRAVKTTVTLTWDKLTYADVSKIRNAFTHSGKAFFSLTFTNDVGQRETISCYSDTIESTIRTYRDSAGCVTGISVSVIQK